MSEKKRKTQTPSQEITSELERIVISPSSSQRSKTSRQTSPSSLPTTRISRISRQASPRSSSRTSPPSFSSIITTTRTSRTSPPSFSSTATTATSRTQSTSRTQRLTSPSSQYIEISSSPPSPVIEPYVLIPQRPSTTLTDQSIARFMISTRGHTESTPRRTYGRVRGRGRGRGLGRKYEEKGKEVIRDDYGSPQEGWIDIGSGIKKSVSLESQIKYTIENNHVYIKFI